MALISCHTDEPRGSSRIARLSSRGGDSRDFTFDAVYDATSKQEEIYNETATLIVDSCMTGSLPETAVARLDRRSIRSVKVCIAVCRSVQPCVPLARALAPITQRTRKVQWNDVRVRRAVLQT